MPVPASVPSVLASGTCNEGEGAIERTERYEIRVQGVLDPHWSAWFEGLELRSEPGGVTVLAGPVADQAALHGLLARVRDLGLPLLSVHRIDPEPRQ
jgi:hypothetical protein